MAKKDRDLDAILTLHRYFVWANWMHRVFWRLLKSRGPDPEAMSLDGFLYMCHWLAALHVVVEGWRRLQKGGNPHARDAKIDALLTPGNVKYLETFRDGVYHYHLRYFNEKMREFMKDSDRLAWANRLHPEFRRFFASFPGAAGVLVVPSKT